MIEFVLFDFDGTLMDTSEGVFHSFDNVVSFYGLSVEKSVYSGMIGPPLKESFEKILKLPQSEISSAMEKYREYYSEKGMYEAEIYPGVEECIKNLRNSGRKIFVATSKPEIYAKKILERKGILNLFDFVGGSDLEEKFRVEKSDVIDYVLSSNGASAEKEKCIMVGDRKFDVEGAHRSGIKCAGILWGFGSRVEFNECGADFVLESPRDVEKFILQAGEF
jgi:phosphoglycolate phosphatase